MNYNFTAWRSKKCGYNSPKNQAEFAAWAIEKLREKAEGRQIILVTADDKSSRIMAKVVREMDESIQIRDFWAYRARVDEDALNAFVDDFINLGNKVKTVRSVVQYVLAIGCGGAAKMLEETGGILGVEAEVMITYEELLDNAGVNPESLTPLPTKEILKMHGIKI